MRCTFKHRTTNLCYFIRWSEPLISSQFRILCPFFAHFGYLLTRGGVFSLASQSAYTLQALVGMVRLRLPNRFVLCSGGYCQRSNPSPLWVAIRSPRRYRSEQPLRIRGKKYFYFNPNHQRIVHRIIARRMVLLSCLSKYLTSSGVSSKSWISSPL